MESLEATDEQDTLYVPFLDLLGQSLKLALGQSPFRTQEGASHGSPAVDGLPWHGFDVTVDEAFDAVVNSEWVVTF